jgi:hypothetical protein
MNFKKTFWMNVIGSIAWVLLCLLSFATDVDYVEHSLTHKAISFVTQLLFLTTFVITAFHLYKPNAFLIRKLALFGNYLCVIVTILYLLAIVYYQLSMLISIDFLFVVFLYCLFILPFIINIKAIKAS